MQRTLIAVFDNRADAQSAVDELVKAGFSHQQMRLSEGDPSGATAGSEQPGGFVDNIKNFLSTMFGTDNSEHAQKYTDAVTRGHHVLTLTAADAREVERAADIVERYGPVDIDEKAAQWSGGALAGEAMRMGAGAQQRSAAMSQQRTQGGPGAAPGAVQGATQAGSQQRAGTAEDGTVPVNQRIGVRVFTHLAEPPLDASGGFVEADEIYFRGHYNSNFAGAS